MGQRSQLWIQDRGSPAQAFAMGALFNPELLTLGFCALCGLHKGLAAVLKMLIV
jgi:hypothetical protein